MTANDDQQLKKTIPYGYASLVWNPRTANLVVTLSLTSLVPTSAHSACIRRGDCANMGPVVYALRDALADRHGNVFATTTISGVTTGIPPSGWCISVQRIADPETSDPVAPVYCGTITNPSPTTNHVQIVRVRLA